MARPMPREPPVITALRPVRSIIPFLSCVRSILRRLDRPERPRRGSRDLPAAWTSDDGDDSVAGTAEGGGLAARASLPQPREERHRPIIARISEDDQPGGWEAGRLQLLDVQDPPDVQ